MMCPECNAKANCIDSRPVPNNNWVRRRYECPTGHRFNTLESVIPGIGPGKHTAKIIEAAWKDRMEKEAKEMLRKTLGL